MMKSPSQLTSLTTTNFLPFIKPVTTHMPDILSESQAEWARLTQMQTKPIKKVHAGTTLFSQHLFLRPSIADLILAPAEAPDMVRPNTVRRGGLEKSPGKIRLVMGF